MGEVGGPGNPLVGTGHFEAELAAEDFLSFLEEHDTDDEED